MDLLKNFIGLIFSIICAYALVATLFEIKPIYGIGAIIMFIICFAVIYKNEQQNKIDENHPLEILNDIEEKEVLYLQKIAFEIKPKFRTIFDNMEIELRKIAEENRLRRKYKKIKKR